MKRSEFKYYVIQFLELPYEDINEYVCVPWSWIVIRRQIDQKVMVSYPVESPSETARRVKKRQKRSLDWKLYMSDVKYGTDLYQNALIYIEGIMDDVHYEHKGSNMMNRDQKSAMVKKKTRRPKKNAKSNHEIDKPQNLVVSSKNDDKSATKRLKRTALPNLDTQVALKRSKVVESAEPVSEAAEQPCQAFECSNENQSSPTHEDFSIQNSYTSEIPVEESDDRSCVNETEHVENSIQERPSVIQNSLNLTNSLPNPNKIIANPAFSTELFTVLRSLHTVCANSYSMIDLLRRRLIENTEALNDVKKLVVDIRSSSSVIQTASPSTNTTVEVERISTTRRSKQKQQDDEYDDHDDDDDNDDDYDDDDEVPLAKTGKNNSKRCCKRKFVLPPEYDENDSRWTLKYRELSPGLVELMPHTNVYVNSVQLSNCKRLSKDCKSLARLLMVEIFTKNALTVCSLTGSRARAYDDEGAVVRPGLDENARIVLLTFVEEYGREKSWITLDTQSIQNSIRNKMQEFRFKYG